MTPATGLRHSISDAGVTLSLLRGGVPYASGTVTEGEARRLAWGLLADLEPDTPAPRPARFERTLCDGERALRRHWKLTPTEASMLWALYQAKGALLDRQAVVDAMYATAPGRPQLKSVDVFVCLLRKKTGEGVIETELGSGLALTATGLLKCGVALGSLA